MLPRHEQLQELTPEQWAAGREIAEYCEISEEVLGQNMLWRGYVANVEYGLAHSAHHMDELNLTTEEIRTAIFDGIAALKATYASTDRDR